MGNIKRQSRIRKAGLTTIRPENQKARQLAEPLSFNFCHWAVLYCRSGLRLPRADTLAVFGWLRCSRRRDHVRIPPRWCYLRCSLLRLLLFAISSVSVSDGDSLPQFPTNRYALFLVLARLFAAHASHPRVTPRIAPPSY